MKLEKKHLAPYLPYGLKVWHTENIEFGKQIQKKCELNGIFTDCCTFINASDWYFNTEENECDIKPILRPLSDINKEIEINGEKVNPSEILINKNFGFSEKSGCIEEYLDAFTLHYKDYNEYPYWLIQFLCKYHFDFMGLIPAGLAVDINTLNKPKDSPGGYGGC